MTPEERAEKIYAEYGRRGSWNYFDKRMVNVIAAQIREAKAEALEEAANICRETCAWSAEKAILALAKFLSSPTRKGGRGEF